MRREVVYFIADGGDFIKIGYTANIDKRFAALRGSNTKPLTLIGCVDGTRRHELALHELLAEHRGPGEWFRDCPDVREVVRIALSEGFSAFEVPPERTAELSQSMREAMEMANIVIAYTNQRDALSTIETIYGIKSGLLWRLKYRPGNDLFVGEYLGLVKGALLVLENEARSIQEKLDWVRGIQQAWDDRRAKADATGQELARLEQELAELRGQSVKQ